MTFATHYNVGTVTVTAGSDAVAGVGTFWNGNITPGDILWVAGVSCRILAVTDNTNLTLARPWPGATAAGAYYEAWTVLDAVGYQKKTGELLTKLASGNLDAFAGLVGAADRLPHFDGAGSMALTPLTAFARSLLDDADVAAFWTTIGSVPDARLPAIPPEKLPAIPAGNIPADLTPDKAFRRGNVLGTVAQSGGVPTGALIEQGTNANGVYVRFADGTQIAEATVLVNLAAGASIDIIYPAAFTNSPSRAWGNVSSTFGGGAALANAWACSAGATGPAWRIFNNGAAFGADTSLRLMAIGRWF